MLLIYVIECQLHNYLPEWCVCLTPLYRFRIPYHIVHLCCLSLLIEIFSNSAETEWYANSNISAKLVSLPLGNRLLLKRIDQLMLSHVNEHLLPVLVLRLHHEPCTRLYNRTSLTVNQWLPVLIHQVLLVALQLLRHFTFGDLLVHLHDLFVRVILEELLCLLRHGRSLLLLRSRLFPIEHVEHRICLLICVTPSRCHPRQLSKFPLKLVHLIN